MLLTLASNAGLLIGVLTVKNGFSSIYDAVYQPLSDAPAPPAHLDICLPEVDEECADAVVVLDVVQEDKLDCATFSHVAAGGDSPPVGIKAETVHSLCRSTPLR